MGLFGGDKKDTSGSDSRAKLKKINKLYKKLGKKAPSLEDLQVDLESPELVGLLDAQQLSDYDQIEGDPRLRDTRMEALEGLREGAELGLTAQDRAERRELQREDAGRSQSQIKGIEQSMAQQGMGSSGASLIAKLQAQENAAARANQQSEALIGDVEGGRRQALQQAGAMAGSIGVEDFKQNMSQEGARRSIEQFNAANRQNVNSQNLNARQAIANQQSNIANQQATQNASAHQTQFANRANVAQGRAGSYQAQAGTYGGGAKKPGALQSLGTVAGGVIGGMYGGAAGASAGAAAGGAIGGGVDNLEDGGISGEDVIQAKLAQNREKVREVTGFDESNLGGGKAKLQAILRANKEKLMNRANGGVAYAEGGLAFGDAFSQARETQGRGGEFEWQGNRYNTNKKDETGEGFAIGSDPESQKAFHAKSDALIMAKEKAAKDAESKKFIEGANAIGEIGGMLGGGEQAAPIKKQQYDVGGMGAVGALDNQYQGIDPNAGIRAGQLSTAYEQPQFEDGGVFDPSPEYVSNMEDGGLSGDEMKLQQQLGAKEEINRDADLLGTLGLVDQMGGMPAYQDGGTHQAEDGSLEFLSDGSGDIVEGESFERDRVDAKLNSGEMVLNAAQQQRLMEMIRGTAGPEGLGEEDIVEGVPQDFQQDLISEAPKKNKKDKQSVGFKKLLEMLGE